MDNIDSVISLLNHVDIINRKNAEILDATGERFNIFRACGVHHYETQHSAIIAEFLNPQGSHGLKHKFLECFVDTLGENFDIKNFNCEKASVKIEHKTENEGRLDILIKDNQNKAIIIENKFYHNDESEQLKRYYKYAERVYKKGNYQILYLTIDGKKASTQSGDGVQYLQISHRETIINWLEKCISFAGRHDIVRNTIIQYINHLKTLTNQDMNAKNKEEIVDLIVGNKQLLESLEYVTNNNIFNECSLKIQKNIEGAIKNASKELGLICIIDEGFGDKVNETSAKLFKEKWDFHILFHWDGVLLFGLDKNEKCAEETVVKIRELLSDFNDLGYENWIFVSEVGEWNDNPSLADKSDFKFVYERTKEVLEALNERYFIQ